MKFTHRMLTIAKQMVEKAEARAQGEVKDTLSGLVRSMDEALVEVEGSLDE